MKKLNNFELEHRVITSEVFDLAFDYFRNRKNRCFSLLSIECTLVCNGGVCRRLHVNIVTRMFKLGLDFMRQ